MKLIIQIPCYNESETLHLAIADLPEILPGTDVIEALVIDDGSTDGTAAVAKELAFNHITQHGSNRGLAAAFSTGLSASLTLGADIIVNTGGDHQYPGDSISYLVRLTLCDGVDIAIGDRRPGLDRRIHFSKRILHKIGRRIVRRLVGQDLPDPVSGFRAFHRDARSKIAHLNGVHVHD